MASTITNPQFATNLDLHLSHCVHSQRLLCLFLLLSTSIIITNYDNYMLSGLRVAGVLLNYLNWSDKRARLHFYPNDQLTRKCKPLPRLKFPGSRRN